MLIFLLLLTLSVAAPKMAQALRRDREVEAIHRGNDYVRAIQLYYAKFGHYPGNMDQLEKSNNIRFLRQKYVDPLTGKPDWRLIHVGEAKTTVKGFFGQPLAGFREAARQVDLVRRRRWCQLSRPDGWRDEHVSDLVEYA